MGNYNYSGKKRDRDRDLVDPNPIKRSKPSPPPPPPPPPPFTNWQNEVTDEKTQQDIIIYYEVRDVLCNVWMKKILSWPTNALEDHKWMVGLDIDAVNQRYLDVMSERDIPNATSNERLLNLLERIHRVVCSYPQEDRGLEETLLKKEDPNMPTAIAGVIGEFDANIHEQAWSAPPRQHGRSICTCRLQHSNASNNDKKNRIDHIRRLVCNEWGEELDRILQIRPGQAGYLPGDGPFQQTEGDPDRDADDGVSQWMNTAATKRLNEMLLTLWRIICLPDAPVFYPRIDPESTCPECVHGWWCTHTQTQAYSHY